jgi:quercetin dioxygenase-like cupin family protein
MKKLLTCMALIALAVPALAQHAPPVVPGKDTRYSRGHIATLGDPTKPEMVVQRFNFPPNHRIAPHTHTHAEVATVLSGTLGLGG